MNTSSSLYFIAIDEVGRGALAGPVCVGASLWEVSISHEESPNEQANKPCQNCIESTKILRPFIQDSKILQEKTRESFFDQAQKLFPSHLLRTDVQHETTTAPNPCRKPLHHVSLEKHPLQKSQALAWDQQATCLGFALGSASSQEVDTYNIWGAIQRAASRALASCVDLYPHLIEHKPMLWIDGKLPFPLWEPYHTWPQWTWIKGDGEATSIGFSSILAKVARDRTMRLWDAEFPAYGFAKHKGYGTERHRKALKEGLCHLHRRSFLGCLNRS